MIQLQQITKTYTHNQQTLHALQDITLTITRSEIFGIVGESGAGKSTLLRTVNLLERPTSGQVIVDEVNFTKLSPQQLKLKRRNIGMIFQHFNLLASRTAFENIALPLELLGYSKSAIQQEVSVLLELVNLTSHQYHYPKQLSGGQKQRVAIARALATKPHVLLCDEPTSALDVKSTSSILQLLKEINQRLNVTILIITHELEVVKQICHRAAVLDQGRLIEYGRVLDIFTKPQSPITQQLVQRALHIELPSAIKNIIQKEPVADKAWIVRFTFVNDTSNLPLVTTLVKKFDITISIIQANIENIQDATVGFTVCQLSGSAVALQQALQFAEAAFVTVEVLGYV